MVIEFFSNCEKVFDFFIKLDPFSKTFANLFNDSKSHSWLEYNTHLFQL